MDILLQSLVLYLKCCSVKSVSEAEVESSFSRSAHQFNNSHTESKPIKSLKCRYYCVVWLSFCDGSRHKPHHNYSTLKHKCMMLDRPDPIFTDPYGCLKRGQLCQTTVWYHNSFAASKCYRFSYFHKPYILTRWLFWILLTVQQSLKIHYHFLHE